MWIVRVAFLGARAARGRLPGMKRQWSVPDLTPEQVRCLLDYDPATGILTWRLRPIRPGFERQDKGWNTRFAGKPAGRLGKHGHFYVGIAYRRLYETRNFSSHRLAWVHYYGEWPTCDIDHKNRDPADNRIDNLRLTTQTQNLGNARMRKDNTSGVRGVYRHKSGKWYAFITRDKRVTYLGSFVRKEDAIACRQRAALEVFGEFANETIIGSGRASLEAS